LNKEERDTVLALQLAGEEEGGRGKERTCFCGVLYAKGGGEGTMELEERKKEVAFHVYSVAIEMKGEDIASISQSCY